MAVIEAVGLGKRYGSKPAVINLSFRVNPGSVTGFLGPNGAGKSTTMRLMLGLDNGDGSTTFDGVPFRSLPQPMRHVGARYSRPARSIRLARPVTTCGCSPPPTRSPKRGSTRCWPSSG